MSGIQISGLLSNSAFDWKSVVDQLIAVDSRPITTLNQQKDQNSQKSAAIAAIQTSFQDLKDSLQAIRAGDVFSARTVSADVAATTWKSSSVTGAPLGSYTFAVSQLATAARLQGATNISSGLAATSDVSGVTLSTMRTATPVTAGTFTVDGQQVTVALTDSLQDVFTKITAAAPDVTASYDAATDAVTLARPSGELVLGAANDTSNFLSVLKLANNGTRTTSSAAALGVLKLTSPLASAGLTAGFGAPAIDGSGNGSFTLNGVAIAYNANTDTLGAVLNRINAAGAGVTASYDSANDRVLLANKATGDTGIAVSEAAGGLLDALGLSTTAGGTLVHGKNAQFRVNGGPLLSSTSNTLGASAHGIDGLSVTVNTETTQTLQIESDTAAMSSSIQTVLDKFNALQDLIETNTKIDVAGGSVTTAILSDNREVQHWGQQIRALAFDAIVGGTGSIQRLDHLGIDFSSTSGHLTVKDSGKLATALSTKPEDVNAFFLSGSTGFVPRMYGYITDVTAASRSQQANFGKANHDLDTQIATLQSRLAAERETLTNSFIKMLDAQSAAQSQNTYLTNAFFKNNSNN